MPEWLILLTADIKLLITDLQMGGVLRPATFGFLAILWLFPMKGVDRRDYLTGLDFIGFLCAATVILLFAVPESFNSQTSSHWRDALTTLLVVSVLGAARWLIGMYRYELVPVKGTTPKGKSNG